MRARRMIATCTANARFATIQSASNLAAGVPRNVIGGVGAGRTDLAEAVLHRASIRLEYPPRTRIEGEARQLAREHPGTG